MRFQTELNVSIAALAAILTIPVSALIGYLTFAVIRVVIGY